jgi:hypothetical protein
MNQKNEYEPKFIFNFSFSVFYIFGVCNIFVLLVFFYYILILSFLIYIYGRRDVKFRIVKKEGKSPIGVHKTTSTRRCRIEGLHLHVASRIQLYQHHI